MSTISASTTSTTAYKVTADTTGTLVLQTGATPTTAVTIDGSQNVGIGTSSPNSATQAGSVTVAGCLFAKGYLGAHQTSVGVIEYNSNVTAIRSYGATAGSGILAFNTGGGGGSADKEAGRFDSSGRMLIGTTSSFASTAFLQVNTYQNGAAAVGFSTKPSTNVNYDACDWYNSSGTNVGYISCTASATIYSTASDYRLKENIAPMTGALDKVAQLKPVTYTWKLDGSASQGFIAHELQEVVPDCVRGEKDAVNEDGSIKPQSIDTSFLVATLTAAIKELKAELDAAKADIATLKGAA